MNLIKSLAIVLGFLYAMNGVTGGLGVKIFRQAQILTQNIEGGVNDAGRLALLSPAQQDQIIQQHLQYLDTQQDEKR
jgi:hypothetical protein